MQTASKILGLVEMRCQNCSRHFGFVREEEIKQALQETPTKNHKEYLRICCCSCEWENPHKENEFKTWIEPNYYIIYRTY